MVLSRAIANNIYTICGTPSLERRYPASRNGGFTAQEYSKLIEMRLTTMADAFRNQLDDPKFKDVPFEDRFGMLVDIEYSNRKNNRQKRLIRNAGFDQPEANIMDINYTSGRKLNKDLINRLATCEFISEHRNLFITGATGCGKTYMACAFGMEACKQYYKTRYVRMPNLLMDLNIARTEGNYRKTMAKYSNPVLLILDEWMLLKPTDTEQKDIFELLHRRRKKSSTIFCSSVLSMYSKNGTISLEVKQVLWLMRSSTVLLMTATRLISQALMLSMTDQCERCTA